MNRFELFGHYVSEKVLFSVAKLQQNDVNLKSLLKFSYNWKYTEAILNTTCCYNSWLRPKILQMSRSMSLQLK